jgi:hypothetical protein
VSHPFLYGGEQLPELPGVSEKLVADRKQSPSAAASWAIARFTSPVSDAARFAGSAQALFSLLNKVFACLENAQQDAQLPRAVFPRVPAPVVEHTRYNSSRKRRQLNQPAAAEAGRKDPRFFIAGSDRPVHFVRHTRLARIRTFIPSR